MNYIKYKDFMVQLGLLTEASSLQIDSQERPLLYDLWKILHGEENEHIYIENLRVMIQVILRLIDPKRVLNVPAKYEANVDG